MGGMSMRTRRVSVVLVMVTLVTVVAWWSSGLLAQTPSGTKTFDPTVVDPQAAIAAAVAAFKQAQAVQNFTPSKTPWGDPDISGYYLDATYTPLQRPDRLKNKAFFTEEEALAELTRVIIAVAKVDQKDVHYDWEEYGMDGWERPVRPSLRTALVARPEDVEDSPRRPE